MRNPLNKRLKRDLVKNKGRYIAIALLFIVVISVISAFLVVLEGVEDVYYDNQIECKVEDGLFSSYFEVPKDVLDDIEKKGAKVYENYYIEDSFLKNDTLRIYKNRKDVNLISVMEGKIAKNGNEISLERLYAKNNNIDIGDTIEFQGIEYKVTALVATPDYSSLFKSNSDMLMDSYNFGVAFLTEEGFNKLSTTKLLYNYSYYFDDRDLTENEEKELSDDIVKVLVQNNIELKNFCTADNNQSITFVESDLGSDIPLIKVFLFIIIGIMAFVFAIIISSTIEEEAAIIGTLRASGYTKYELLRHYMKLPIIVTFISSLFGNILGYFVMPDMFKSIYYSNYSVPIIKTEFNFEALLLTTVLPIILMILINFVILIKKLSISPLNFLKKDLRKKSNKKPIKLPNVKFISRFRMRVIIQNLGNYIIMLIGIVFGTFILMFGLGLEPTITNYLDDIEESSAAKYQYILKMPYELESEGDIEKYTIGSFETKNEVINNNMEVTVYGIKENSEFFPDLSINEEEGIYISESVSKKFSYNKGDKITLTNCITKEKHKLDIAGTYDYPSGLTIFMNQKSLNKLLNYKEDYFNGYFSDKELNIDENYLATKITSSDMVKAGENMMATFEATIPIFVIVAIIIYLVIMYILTKIVIDKNAISISFMKVFGYDEKEISKLYLKTTTYVVIISLIISLPIANLLLKFAMDIAFSKVSGYISVYIPIITFILIVAIGMLSYFTINFLHLRHVKKIKMSEALKDRE